MKPPVSIDVLTEEWMKDAPIDETEPGRELAKVPVLHAKYLNILSYHKIRVAKIMTDYNNLKSVKFQYYKGDLNNPEDLAHYGLVPFERKAGKDVTIYLDQDKDLTQLLLKKIIHQEIVDYCTAVLKELNNRTWQLKSIVDWEKSMRPNG